MKPLSEVKTQWFSVKGEGKGRGGSILSRIKNRLWSNRRFTGCVVIYMSFGENKQLVGEVMDFIRNNKMFNKKEINGTNIQVVSDFSKAQNFAWSQDLNEVDTVWEYVKSIETESIVEKVYNLDLASQQDDLYEYFGDYKNYSNNFLPFDFIDINEEDESDLVMCALNRLVNGKTDNFYERVFNIYRQGGWPCGWKGTYPNGEIIVYTSQ